MSIGEDAIELENKLFAANENIAKLEADKKDLQAGLAEVMDKKSSLEEIIRRCLFEGEDEIRYGVGEKTFDDLEKSVALIK